jgi:hypothetical protein
MTSPVHVRQNSERFRVEDPLQGGICIFSDCDTATPGTGDWRVSIRQNVSCGRGRSRRCSKGGVEHEVHIGLYILSTDHHLQENFNCLCS